MLYNFLIPSEMFAVVALGDMAEIERDVYHNVVKARAAKSLRDEVQRGIQTYGFVLCRNTATSTPTKSTGSVTRSSPTMRTSRACSRRRTSATRRRRASSTKTRAASCSRKDNPSFYQGQVARGIGSYHTPRSLGVAAALIVQGMTATSGCGEAGRARRNCSPAIRAITACTNRSIPTIRASYSRVDFGWPNALFSEFVMTQVQGVAADPDGRHRRPGVPSANSKALHAARSASSAAAAVDIIVGIQWGDEGKGRIVDLLAEDYDVVARFGGGDNAGHSIVVGDQKLALRIVPSGVLVPSAKLFIGERYGRHRSRACSTNSTRSARSASTSRASRSPIARTSCFPYHAPPTRGRTRARRRGARHDRPRHRPGVRR